MGDDDTATLVPRTDDEVKERIRSIYASDGELVIRNLIGIFEVSRMRGMTVHDAWEHTLHAYLEASGYQESK